MKTNKQFSLLFFVSLFMIIPLLFVDIVSCYSAEITGVDTHLISNKNRFCIVGDYNIYCIGDTAYLFDNDGVYVKNFVMGGGSEVESCVYEYNTTAFLFYCSWYYYSNPNYYDRFRCYLIDVETLNYDITCSDDSDSVSSGQSAYGQSIAYLDNGYFYAIDVTCSYDSAIEQVRLVKLTGSGTGDIYTYNIGDTVATHFENPIVFIKSETESTKGYFIVGDYNGTYQACVYEVDVNTPSFTYLGTTGMDDTWGDYVYFVGSSYDTDEISVWYDVCVIHNDYDVSESLYAEIIRFNNTYVSYHRTTGSFSSAVNKLRAFSVCYNGLWTDTEELLEGTYRVAYVGESYAMMQILFDVSGLSTLSSFYIGYSGSSYTYQAKTHYYTGSNNVGGLQPPITEVGLYIDYQNAKAIADLFWAFNPSSSFVYWLSPSPIYLLDDDFEIYQNQIYTYTGENFANQLVYGDGTYMVYTTGLMTSWEILDETTPTNVLTTGYVNDGLFSFLLTSRVSSQSPIFERLKVSYTIEGTTYSVYHKIAWVKIGDEDWWSEYLFPTETPSPQPDFVPATGTEWGVNFVVLFLVVFCPPMVVAFLAQQSRISPMVGYIAGLALTIMIGYQSGLLPIWFIFGIIIIMAIIILALIHSRGEI